MAHDHSDHFAKRLLGGTVLGAVLSAGVCFGLTAGAGAAQASDAGRITGDAINRPGVALPLDRQGVQPIPVPTTPAVPGGQAAGAAPDVQMTKEPSLFTHPVRGFQLPIPAGVAVAHRGEEMHVAVRSPRGYVMNTQTGDANPAVPLPNMLARLETRYLGERGPWQRKLGSAETMLSGLPAIDAMYQGHRTRTRVVIARGNNTDFVFTFTAPLDLYADQERNFDWVLGNFKPGPGERPAAPPVAQSGPDKTMARVPVRAGGTVDSFAAGRPVPNQAATPAPDMHRFTDPGYGFVIDYPKEWEVTKPTAFSASFSGPEGQASHDAVVSVQNVNPAGARSSDESASIATADLLKALDQGTRHLTVLGEGKLAESPGSQFIARYDYSGTTYRKWAVVVPRPDGKIAHVWSFTAPDKAFDNFRPVAESMLRSWTLTQ